MITIGDIIAFDGIGFAAFAFILAVHFAGFYIRGALGFGSNMPIVLLTAWVLGPHQAILLVALTSGLAQIHLLPQGFRHTDWSIARILAFGMMAGIGFGVWVFAGIEADWLVMLLGALIIGILLMDRFWLIERLQTFIDLRSPILAGVLATISGTVGTISGGGGLYFCCLFEAGLCDTGNFAQHECFSGGRFHAVPSHASHLRRFVHAGVVVGSADCGTGGLSR